MNRNTEIPLKNRMASDEYYPTYEEREARKSEGWRLFSSSEFSNFQKAHAILNTVIWAHYWRTRIDIENSKYRNEILRLIRGDDYYTGYILDIDHYTKHWLAANGDRLLGPEIVQTIAAEFGYEPENNEYLPKGMSMYQGFKTEELKRMKNEKME